jgi:hypothetical protein
MVEAMAATLQRVFPSVHVIGVPQTFNAILVATVRPTTPENLRANLALLQQPLLRAVASDALNSLRLTQPGPVVFTDDRAPVEQLTNAIVLRFALQTALGQVVLP